MSSIYLGKVNGVDVTCESENDGDITNTLNTLDTVTGARWGAFREERGKKNLVFYRVDMYEVNSDDKFTYLHFKGLNYAELPLNCSSCYSMFHDKRMSGKQPKTIEEEHTMKSKLGYSFSGDFKFADDWNTENIVDMCRMFMSCKFPESFSLGHNFDTSNVTDMMSMFNSCEFSPKFSLGNKFYTKNVVNMAAMFYESSWNESFSLGEYFDTSNVQHMSHMFTCVRFPNNFTLGDSFNTEHVQDMQSMFSWGNLPENFELNENFNTWEVKDMRCMFANCEIPETFKMGSNFKVMRGTRTDKMFSGAKLPDGQTDKDFTAEAAIVSWLKYRFEEEFYFSAKEYLKDYMTILPAASVAACKTKEDCDQLLERLGLK